MVVWVGCAAGRGRVYGFCFAGWSRQPRDIVVIGWCRAHRWGRCDCVKACNAGGNDGAKARIINMFFNQLEAAELHSDTLREHLATPPPAKRTRREQEVVVLD